ncbi:glycosyltransferase [Gordonia sp. CNJ-863]|uniref:glycosyltransferase n=1 Tax=Gordonia sp. CNJ-863 TaxID=1904963 RepID=UPI000962575F|nr:glycosyltransferase family 2 protein [Gordonia sp. CNJ-863]OLT40459.1 glycosyltransferase [Gordonia sp. CNJ-863]
MIDKGYVDRRPGLEPVRRIQDSGKLWGGAIWIGQVDLHELDERPGIDEQGGHDPERESNETDSPRIELIGGDDFRESRFLVWSEDRPLGLVRLPVQNGTIDGVALREQARGLPEPPVLPERRTRPGVSVVICTRDRPDHLARLLDSLVTLDYPDFEVLVVDNNPVSGLTPPVVAAACPSIPVRVVDAAGPGLSIARNVGLRSARFELVAFTDDDVVLDPNWLSRIVIGFERDESVACVCGMVPSVEVMTPAQAYFDRRVGWAERWEPALYGVARPVAADDLFPLRVSEFGTGANFAVRRDVVVGLGGFDEAVGAGSAAGGGEDIDIFVRLLLAGGSIAREPAAIVWHSHRASVAELEKQMHDYGVGLGAVIFKLLVDPCTTVLVTKRLVAGIRHLRATTQVDPGPAVVAEPELAGLRRRELVGVARGPWRLIRGRLAGRAGAPLRATSRGLAGLLDFRRGQMWGEPGNTILEGRLAAVSMWLGLVGLLGATMLPGVLQVVAVIAFVLLGPGSLVMSFGSMPTHARLSLVPAVGLAVSIVAVTGLLMAGFWSPAVVLAIIGIATTAGGLGRGAHLASRVAHV